MIIVRAAIVPIISATVALLPGAALAAGASCESLAAMKLPNARIDVAGSVPAGDFALPGEQGRRGQTFKNLPAFCRVAATLAPSSDSDIKVEVWLPANRWNGKFQAVGNGGWAGTIRYDDMADALRAGYATTSTDTGHSSPGGSFVQGHPEKLIDYSWRSEHEMTLKAKAIIAAFYGNGPKYSYWNGCSTGGRQGLKEATLFPNEYDGLVIGDPANLRAQRNSWQMSVTLAIAKTPGGFLPDSKLETMHRAVLNACDALDGVKDGLIENPKACGFDPAVLACKGADGPDCLTAAQLQSVRVLMSPGKLSSGEEYQPGLELGSETGFYPGRGQGWSSWASEHPDPGPADNFIYVVYKDPKWDWKTFNADSALQLAKKANAIETADAADLAKFLQHGKVVMYHGWADPSVAPQATINYYNGMLKTGAKAAQSVRLFMVPGMGHCMGGDGVTDKFDAAAALDAWVTNGNAPQQIVARNITNGIVNRSRPLCAYPQVARHKGAGSTDDAANFACVAP